MQKHPSLGFRAGISVAVLASAALFSPVAQAAPPVIDYPPRDQEVILYQQAAFGVIAGGTAPLSYQWLKHGVPIPGATNYQIVIQQTQFSDEGLYSVIVSNAEGAATSAQAELTVMLPRAGDLDFSFSRTDPAGFLGPGGTIGALLLQEDGKLLVGGGTPGTDVSTNVVRVMDNGAVDGGFISGIRGGHTGAFARQNDGKILVGGGFRYFTTNQGVVQASFRIGRLHSDGAVDDAFQCSIAEGHVASIAIQQDGRILIGGFFETVNGISRTNLARVHSDGSIDTGFAPMFSPGSINSILIQNDERIVIGGAFTNVDGVARTNIVRLSSNGNLDSTFECTELSGARVFSVAAQTDGRLLVGGWFRSADGANSGIARLFPDGTLDTSFQCALSGPFGGPIGTAGIVCSIVIQPDGRILVGGGFDRVNGLGWTNLVRLNSEGSIDAAFQSVAFEERDRVACLAMQSDGKVVIGGDFKVINGSPADGFARLWGEDFPPVLKALAAIETDANLTWHAIPDRTYRVQYTDDLLSDMWVDLPGDVQATGHTASKTDANPSGGQRFYRVVRLP